MCDFHSHHVGETICAVPSNCKETGKCGEQYLVSSISAIKSIQGPLRSAAGVSPQLYFLPLPRFPAHNLSLVTGPCLSSPVTLLNHRSPIHLLTLIPECEMPFLPLPPSAKVPLLLSPAQIPPSPVLIPWGKINGPLSVLPHLFMCDTSIST